MNAPFTIDQSASSMKIADLRLKLMAHVNSFNALAGDIHADNIAAGWWSDLATGAPLKRNVGELLMLVVTELVEAGDAEGCDDKLPTRQGLEVELADAAIRLFDIAGHYEFDIGGAADELLGHPDRLTRLDNVFLFDVVKELGYALEGFRKDSLDGVLTDRPMGEVRIAAALLRIYSLGEMCRCDIPAAMAEKRAYNRNRADHKPENRRKSGGKQF